MATLTGQTIASTYDGLLKLSDNDGLTASVKNIEDGFGVASPVNISTAVLFIKPTSDTSSTPTSGKEFEVVGNSLFTGDVIIDNITIDGNTITVASSDFVVDSNGGNIILDSSGGDIVLKDTGTEFGRLKRTGENLIIKSITNDKDIIFKGVDNTSEITALTLDMSEGGNAFFSGNISLQDEKQILLGTGDDFKIYHFNTDAFIQNSTGDITIENFANDKDIIFKSDDGSGGTTAYLTLDGSTEKNVFSKDAFFGDNVKALFGAGSDLEIFHDTGNSIIKDNGTGDLYLMASSAVRITNIGASEHYAKFIENGAVELYHDNSKKLETTSSGVKVTGEVELGDGTANKIQFIGGQGNWRVNISDSANEFIIHSESLAADYFTVIGGGGIKLNAYGSGNKTGTVAKNLAVDSSGNIIETDGGVVDGSGTANDVVMWSDSNTLTDAPIAISGNDATFAGDVTATSKKFISTSSSSGDYVRLYAGSGTAQWDIYGSGENLRLSENSSGGGIFQVDSGATFAGNVQVGTSNANFQAGFGVAIADKVFSYGAEFQATNADIQIVLGRNNGTSVQGTGAIGASGTNAFHIYDTSSVTQLFQIAQSSGNATFAGNVLIDGSNGSTGLQIKRPSDSATMQGMSAPDSSTLKIGGGNQTSVKIFSHTTEVVNFSNTGTSTFTGAVTASGQITGASVSAAGGFLNGSNGGIRIHTSGTKFFNVTAANAARDNIMDIGASDARFKDLFLGGNINAGGAVFTEFIKSNASVRIDIDTDNNQTDRIFVVSKHNAGTELMRINEDGNMGIGTSVTTVGGTDTQTSTATPTRMLFNNNFSSGLTDASLKLYLFNHDTTRHGFTSGPNFDLQYHSSGHSTNSAHTFYTNNNFVMRIGTGDTTNVGIGTTTPAEKLEVSGSIKSTSRAIAGGSTPGITLSYDTSNSIGLIETWTSKPIGIETAGVRRMTILSGGNVGIGTTSPQTFLQIGDYPSNNIDITSYPDVPSEHLLHLTAPETTGRFGGGISWGENSFTAANIVAVDAGAAGALHLAFGTGNSSGMTERMRLTNSGNLGISNSSPSSKIHIGSNSTSGAVDIGLQNDSRHYTIKTDGGNFRIRDESAGANRVSISSGGQFSIGTNSGTTKEFNIKNSGSNGGLRIEHNGSANTVAFLGQGGSGDEGVLFLQDSGSDTVKIAGETGVDSFINSGNLGINETDPQDNLQITDSNGANIIICTNTGTVDSGIYITEGSASDPKKNGAYIHYDPADNGFKIDTGTTSLSTRFQIDRNSGDVFIGGSGSANLYLGNVISASSSNRGMRLHTNNSDAFFDFQGTSSDSLFFRDYDGSGGIHTRHQFVISNGNIVAAGVVTQNGSPSDIKYKENIKTISNGIDKIEKLNPVEFDWNDKSDAHKIGKKEDAGFIAQEVQKVLPNLVNENVDGDLALNYEGIIPYLVQSIQELKKEIEILKNK